LRHALQILEANGLIYRHQGAPTKVVSRRRLRRFIQSYNSPIDILSYSRDTYRQNIVEEFIELDKPLSQIVGAPIGSSWYHSGGIRKRQQAEEILAWTDIYILQKFAKLTQLKDHATEMVYAQIEKHFGVSIAHAEVEISSSKLSNQHAKLLGVNPDSSSLIVLRRYFDKDGNPFEISMTHHPENLYTFKMNLRSSHQIN
jgi:DNA-binding GntR family transcriptional regulator